MKESTIKQSEGLGADMKQRPISIGVPSGKLMMLMWEGTEDQESFPIKGIKTKPYVTAYGVKYYLTDAEVKTMNQLMNLKGEI